MNPGALEAIQRDPITFARMMSGRKGNYDERRQGADAIREAAEWVLPTSPAEAGAMLMFGPLGKAAKLGGLSAVLGGYGVDADASFVGKGSKISRSIWDKAKMLFGKGAGNRDVHAETGVWKGPEGDLRFEVPDQDLTLRTDLDNLPRSERYINEQQDFPLGGLIMHRQLEEQYPGLMGKYRGSITRQPDWIPYETGEQRPPVLGGRNYPGRPGQIDVRAKTPEGALDLYAHELQHAIQSAEGFPLGGSESMFSSNRQPLMEALKRAKANPDGFDPVTGDFDFAIEQQLKRAVDDPYQSYLRLAGEAEARAVAKRRAYGPEQRQEIFPLDDYDVPLNELIYR